MGGLRPPVYWPSEVVVLSTTMNQFIDQRSKTPRLLRQFARCPSVRQQRRREPRYDGRDGRERGQWPAGHVLPVLVYEAARPAGAARAATQLARVLLGGTAAKAEEASVVVRVGAPRLGPA
jgi:hypothetical protein